MGLTSLFTTLTHNVDRQTHTEADTIDSRNRRRRRLKCGFWFDGCIY